MKQQNIPAEKLYSMPRTYVEMEIQLHTFSTSALEVGEVLYSRPCRFTPRDRTPILIRPGVLNLVLF
jgi:hypothetical protein